MHWARLPFPLPGIERGAPCGQVGSTLALDPGKLWAGAGGCWEQLHGWDGAAWPWGSRSPWPPHPIAMNSIHSPFPIGRNWGGGCSQHCPRGPWALPLPAPAPWTSHKGQEQRLGAESKWGLCPATLRSRWLPVPPSAGGGGTPRTAPGAFTLRWDGQSRTRARPRALCAPQHPWVLSQAPVGHHPPGPADRAAWEVEGGRDKGWELEPCSSGPICGPQA